ncbi:terminal uridylyltransferase 7 [Grus japonensis]|uniref:Terminal uridylyltransferase 7 n=1 Tax=Grus japonensis TaxID=30415 RepID=A0ABC9YAQ7_GRUJA
MDDKISIEESTESTDELDESPNKFILSIQNWISEMISSNDETEESSLVNQAECGGIRAEGELDNTCSGSGDEDALSEKVLSIPVKYEDKHVKENVDGPLRINLGQEDLTEKRSLYEENTAIE